MYERTTEVTNGAAAGILCMYSNDSALKCQVVDVMTRCGSYVSGIDWNIN